MRYAFCLLLCAIHGLSTNALTSTIVIDTITIDHCYEWSKENYPLITQLDLISRTTDYNISNASKNKLPQITLYGQATYQSDVTELPLDLPETEIQTLDKDQYKLYAEVYQPLTQFSVINSEKEQLHLNGRIEEQNVEIELYKLKERIEQIYFGILLLEAKASQQKLMLVDLDSTLTKIKAAVKYGTSTIIDKHLLAVEKLNVEQKLSENEHQKAAYIEMLALLTGQIISEETKLIKPNKIFVQDDINRPELKLFELQELNLDIQDNLIQKSLIPSIGLFAQGGFGRPALNLLSNEFEPYYIAGLKLYWNIGAFYSSKNKRHQIAIQKQLVANQRELFALNTNIDRTHQNGEMARYEDNIKSDKEVVLLREQIKTTAEVQLMNGLITTIDYVKILNDANRARQQLKLNEILLLQAQYSINTITGN